MIRTLRQLGEDGWLNLVYASLGTTSDHRVIVPMGDDAAVMRITEELCLVITVDAIVEGTHFQKKGLSFQQLANQSILAAASDITAMGAVPFGILLTTGFSPDTNESQLDEWLAAIREVCQTHQLVVLGGDTVNSEKLFIDVVVIGFCKEDEIIRQTGACPGDSIWVTGELGNARIGWISEKSVYKPNNFIPDVPARWKVLGDLRQTISIRAMTDLSDGLWLDLKKILRTPSLGAVINLDILPVASSAQIFCHESGLDPLEFACLGGEDYELLIVESGSSNIESPHWLGQLPLTRIGQIVDEPEIILLKNGERVTLMEEPYRHYHANHH